MTAGDRTLSFASEGRSPQLEASVLYLVITAGSTDAAIGRFPLVGVDRVRLGRGATSRVRREAMPESVLAIELADGWLSSQHLELCPQTTGAGWRIRDLGSKNGTTVAGHALTAGEEIDLGDGAVIEVGASFLLHRREQLDREQLGDTFLASADSDATLSPAVAAVLARADRIAASEVPVLIGGETGTGKELLARRIHQRSGRPGAFVALNCGAVPANLLESTLFGHRRGAFSGAVSDQPGVFRSADGGTVLLDELGELPPPAQVALLRVLQEREVVPVGDSRGTAVNTRVIGASHRDLQAMVESGALRQDLHMRLRGLELMLPALRQRREDLGLLMAAICARRRPGPVRLSRDAARALMAHDWPGNIRELEQALLTAIELAGPMVDGELALELEHLPEHLGTSTELDLPEKLERLLRQHRGNVSAVARDLGKARVQIRRWCQRYGIDIDAYR